MAFTRAFSVTILWQRGGGTSRDDGRPLGVVLVAFIFSLWFQFVCTPGFNISPCRYEAQDAVDSKSAQLRHLYKRAITLLRTLYSFVRMIPAYQVKLEEDGTGLGLFYVHSGVSSYLQLDQNKRR